MFSMAKSDDITVTSRLSQLQLDVSQTVIVEFKEEIKSFLMRRD